MADIITQNDIDSLLAEVEVGEKERKRRAEEKYTPVLSQDEVDALLAAVADGDLDEEMKESPEGKRARMLSELDKE
jgi:flagellar motor switch protein FliM